MKIYLIRHGETTSDIENRYGGDYDDHLTEKGVKQAQEMARKMKDSNIQLIFSSSKIRARETAKILGDFLNCPVEVEDGIRERNRYGVITGMTKKEAEEKYPSQVALLKDFQSNAENGEPYDNFANRVTRSFNKIINSKYDQVAIISHGGPIIFILRELLGRRDVDFLADCAVIELEKKNGRLDILKEDGVYY